MPDLLRNIPFTPDMLEQVRDFNYGDEPYQKELGDWVCSEERGRKKGVGSRESFLDKTIPETTPDPFARRSDTAD
jgi:hypothetical protein